MRSFSRQERKPEQRHDEQRRMGDVTLLSLAVCAAILLFALYKSHTGQ